MNSFSVKVHREALSSLPITDPAGRNAAAGFTWKSREQGFYDSELVGDVSAGVPDLKNVVIGYGGEQ